MKYHFLALFLLTLFTSKTQAQLESIDLGQLGVERTEILGETSVIRGQISRFEFAQPETLIVIESNFETWQITAPSAVELVRLGWSNSSLFAGEFVEAEVTRQLGVGNLASLEKITRANGSLLLAELSEPITHAFTDIPNGTYSLDSDHSQLAFSYDHMGFSEIAVYFERLHADVLWDSNAIGNSIIQIDIDASSLNSGIYALDNRLRGSELFAALNHPKIQFRSTALNLLKWGDLLIDGQLQIKGINHPVQLKANLVKIGENPLTQNTTVGLTMTGTVKRSAWGLSVNLPLIPDEIDLSFNGEFILRVPDIPAPASNLSPMMMFSESLDQTQ